MSTIGESAFKGCYNLKSVTIGNKVIMSIKDNAFSDCGSLTGIVIPIGVMSIGEDVFNNCNSLVLICCGAYIKPSGWNDKWNGNCTASVVWGYNVN